MQMVLNPDYSWSFCCDGRSGQGYCTIAAKASWIIRVKLWYYRPQ